MNSEGLGAGGLDSFGGWRHATGVVVLFIAAMMGPD